MTDDICNRLTLLEERRIQDRRKIEKNVQADYMFNYKPEPGWRT